MTDRIDLDDLDTDTDTESDDTPRRGDWFWRGEGDPDAEPDATGAWSSRRADGEMASAAPADASVTEGDGDTSEGDGDTSDADTSVADADAGDGEVDEAEANAEVDRQPVPHVPRETKGKPVGIPKESGGAGSGPERGSAGDRDSMPDAGESPAEAPEPEASGPHGGGVDDMTMALTYAAAKRLADPAAALADAAGWTDWVGIVGDVDAHVINKFQRDHAVDADFFNGSGTDPGERLAAIDEHSMFYAERMVVVGLEGEDEGIAREAGWEFVPLAEAAEKAGWELAE